MLIDDFKNMTKDERMAYLQTLDKDGFAYFINEWASSEMMEFPGTVHDELMRRLKPPQPTGEIAELLDALSKLPYDWHLQTGIKYLKDNEKFQALRTAIAELQASKMQEVCVTMKPPDYDELKEDRARLEWYFKHPTMMIYQGDMSAQWFYAWQGKSADGDVYNTPREAIDAAMKEARDE